LQHYVIIHCISDISETDKTLIEKIINQNELDKQKSEMEIIYRSKISNKRFSIILESNELVYKRLIAGEVYIGWSRCKAYEEFGVFRCYKCKEYKRFWKKKHGNQDQSQNVLVKENRLKIS
jgi:hypothetical protein